LGKRLFNSLSPGGKGFLGKVEAKESTFRVKRGGKELGREGKLSLVSVKKKVRRDVPKGKI